MKKGKEVKIEVECFSCDGSGIYSGGAELPGVGIICLSCEGTGRDVIAYVPFTGRRRAFGGIRVVRHSRDRLIVLGLKLNYGEISYKEFFAGKRPRPLPKVLPE